jgi:hypothetical protein
LILSTFCLCVGCAWAACFIFFIHGCIGFAE